MDKTGKTTLWMGGKMRSHMLRNLGQIFFQYLICLIWFHCASGGGNHQDALETETVDQDIQWEMLFGQGCEQNKRVGRFEITHDPKTSASIGGSIYDSVNHAEVFIEKEKAGRCWLMQAPKYFCEPKCKEGEQCTQDNKCLPFPKPVSAGKIEIKGLVKDVMMLPKGQAKKYFYTEFEDKAFLPNSKIELIAQGDETKPFSLQGMGTPDLEITDKIWVLKRGNPLTIRWTKQEGHFRLYIVLNVDAHALSDTNLYCDLEDTGEYTIPAELVDRFLDYGVHGAPTALVYRRTIDSTMIEQGCVEFVVQSKGEVLLQVASP